MDVTQLVVPKVEAQRLHGEYKAHRAFQTPMDREIERTYRLIAAGKVVIQALESIKAAGVGADGYPKLALSRADQPVCRVEMWPSGSARMSPDQWPRSSTTKNFSFPEGSFPRFSGHKNDGVATLPLIPVHLRPRTALDNYHILWEAEWRRVPPRDPYLLRRIGGDMWLVLAAWDLTDVERAAMATRMAAR